MLILINLEVLNFDLTKFQQLSRMKFTKIQSSVSLKLPQMTILDHLNPPKCDFTQNRSGSKIIKFQQSQALTSHFESFWSIVHGAFLTPFFRPLMSSPLTNYCLNSRTFYQLPLTWKTLFTSNIKSITPTQQVSQKTWQFHVFTMSYTPDVNWLKVSFFQKSNSL